MRRNARRQNVIPMFPSPAEEEIEAVPSDAVACDRIVAHVMSRITAGLGWRRGWDSNPRTPVEMLLEFQSSAFDRSATSPL
jgi:hypothetical protein